MKRLLPLALLLAGCAQPRSRPPAVALDADQPLASDPEARTVCRDGVLGGPTTRGRWITTGRAKEVDPARARLVAEALCARSDALRACLREAYKRGPVEGTLELALTLGPAGDVTDARRAAGTIADDQLASCAGEAFATAKLGRPAGSSVIWALSVSRAGVVKIKETGTDIQGRLPPELIKRVVRARFPAIRACYEALLHEDGDARGVLQIQFVIDEKGRPTRVETTGSSLPARTAACMQQVFGALEFPEPELSKVLVRYPLEFSAGEE